MIDFFCSEDLDFVGSSASSEAASSSSDEEAEAEGSDKSDTEIQKPTAPPKKKTKSSSAASSPKVKPAKKKKKDPNAPKRPMTSFLYFSQAKRPQLAEDQPGLSLAETSRALGVLWKAVGSDEKEVNFYFLF